MEFSRKLGMLLVNNRAFAVGGMGMIEVTKEGCRLLTTTGMPFDLDHAELHILKQEAVNMLGGIIHVGNSKYQSPFDCLRGLRWIVLPWRAFNPAAVSVIELIDPDTPTNHYKLTLLGNHQIDLTPEESAHFQNECVNLIWEAQRIAQSMK